MTLTEILFSGKGESISYAIDGVDYAIDLEDGRATEFRDTLGHCIAGSWRWGGGARRSFRGRIRAETGILPRGPLIRHCTPGDR
ncbi:Lsr2 family protein [Rhodococcus jostii]|uniref:Lsr2 protein n=1 Tax=Rhodococcus jostii TaxID=132919 RepID=A0A1H4IIB6_RHOJO|nr:Lsr2 family protein [Rhodococcus jostii]SEB33831.1 Lsr2 protein [Rhodococcus jostii]